MINLIRFLTQSREGIRAKLKDAYYTACEQMNDSPTEENFTRAKYILNEALATAEKIKRNAYKERCRELLEDINNSSAEYYISQNISGAQQNL